MELKPLKTFKFLHTFAFKFLIEINDFLKIKFDYKFYISFNYLKMEDLNLCYNLH